MLTIIIQTNEWSEELEEIVSIIKKRQSKRIFGVNEDQTIIFDPQHIDYIYAEKRKVFATMKDRSVEIKMNLYEFEVSFNGNLCVHFHSNNKEYITRKYVNPIKERLTEVKTNI